MISILHRMNKKSLRARVGRCEVSQNVLSPYTSICTFEHERLPQQVAISGSSDGGPASSDDPPAEAQRTDRLTSAGRCNLRFNILRRPWSAPSSRTALATAAPGAAAISRPRRTPAIKSH